MKLFVCIVLILHVTLAHAQVSYENRIPLQSKGEMPDFIQTNCQFMKFDNSQTPYLTTGKSTPDEVQSVFGSLASNGRLVYGEEVHAFCSGLLRDLLQRDPKLDQSIEIYPFKSSLVSILNDGRSTIYISTALIARASKTEQLYFLIATQLYHLKNKSVLNPIKLNRYPNLNTRLSQLSNYDSLATSKADSFALKLNEELNLDPYFLIEGLNILRQKNDPIEQLEVPNDYFNSDLMTVPGVLFDRNSYRLEKELISPYSMQILDREEELGKLFIGTARVEYQLIRPDFEEVVNLCAFQYVEDLLLENKPEDALYHLFILENRDIDKRLIAKLKAHSWLTIVQKSLYPVYRKTVTVRRLYDSPSSVFYLGLYRLSSGKTASMALGLRIITDLAKDTSNPELGLIRNYLIDLIQKSREFNPNVFYKQSYSEVLANKYSGSQIPVDSPFYAYALSDLVSDPEFINLITGAKPVYEPTEEPLTMLTVESTAFLFHKKKLKEEKTEEKTRLLTESIENNSIDHEVNTSSFTLDSTDKTALTQLYNLRYTFNTLDRQIRNQTNYLRTVFPLNFRQMKELSTNGNEHLLGIFHFENQYNLNIQGYHLTGIFIVPLPFVLTDLVLGGNHCQFISFIIDRQTGNVLFAENSKYRDPLTKPFIKNKIQHSFQTIFKTSSGL
ncbi:hypothetical protein [Fluviicola sp.]|uniref:hypothetical protein n=1 Tax=Fluviicola sp. TaxID=1917219 RepID=UPI0026375558|nr:hypothetical protein [Fluviicola sp.]